MQCVNVRDDSTCYRYTLRGLVSQKSRVSEFDVRGVHIYFAKVQEFFFIKLPYIECLLILLSLGFFCKIDIHKV